MSAHWSVFIPDTGLSKRRNRTYNKTEGTDYATDCLLPSGLSSDSSMSAGTILSERECNIKCVSYR